jgi:hypothetical protein
VRGIDVNRSSAKATSHLRIRRSRARVILGVVLSLSLLSVFIVPPLEQEQHLHQHPTKYCEVLLGISFMDSSPHAAALRGQRPPLRKITLDLPRISPLRYPPGFEADANCERFFARCGSA